MTVSRGDGTGNNIGLQFSIDWTSFDNKLTEPQIMAAINFFENQTANYLAQLQPTWTEQRNRVWDGSLTDNA